MRIVEKIQNQFSNIYKVFLFLTSIVILVLLFPKEIKFKYDFQKGKPWLYEDLIAPFDFAIMKSEDEIQMERKEVEENIKPYFDFQQNIRNSKYNELRTQFSNEWQLKYKNKTRYEKQRIENEMYCIAIFDTIFNRGIIQHNQAIDRMDEGFTINVIKNHKAYKTELSNLFTLKSAYNYIQDQLSNHPKIDGTLLLSVLENSLEYNVIYNHDLTENEKQTLLDGISLTRGMVQSGQRIISKGELLTPEKYQMLVSIKKEFVRSIGTSASYNLILLGQVILVSISMLVLLLFLISFKREIFDNNKKLLLIILLIIMMVGITNFVLSESVHLLYLIPICILPVIIRAFFDSRLALFVHIVTIILIGFMVSNSFEFIFLQLIAGIIAIISVLNLERRAQFFLTSIYIFLVYSGIYLGLNLIQEGGLESVKINDMALFAGSAILTLFSYPLIYVFERLFGFYTDVSLMELSNTRSKLLRELAIKAPGTFQHSMLVANIAEEGIYTVGGNALLARTGALYHDIGKVENPVYFIENQNIGVNPHEELSYEESAKIITAHVIKGIELAKKNKLPEAIIDFIRTHHGTRKTEYFYSQHIKEFPDLEEAGHIFSYKGPIPFSKETSVVMMADSVEAATRSLRKKDEQSINELVDAIIDKHVESGQLTNAAITLKDITILKKIFKKQLKNIYHVRIEYPE
ncbi:HD family phosphohydrolase [candidate division KSB1 bacterium]